MLANQLQASIKKRYNYTFNFIVIKKFNKFNQFCYQKKVRRYIFSPQLNTFYKLPYAGLPINLSTRIPIKHS